MQGKGGSPARHSTSAILTPAPHLHDLGIGQGGSVGGPVRRYDIEVGLGVVLGQLPARRRSALD